MSNLIYAWCKSRKEPRAPSQLLAGLLKIFLTPTKLQIKSYMKAWSAYEPTLNLSSLKANELWNSFYGSIPCHSVMLSPCHNFLKVTPDSHWVPGDALDWVAHHSNISERLSSLNSFQYVYVLNKQWGMSTRCYRDANADERNVDTGPHDVGSDKAERKLICWKKWWWHLWSSVVHITQSHLGVRLLNFKPNHLCSLNNQQECLSLY